MPFYPFWGEGSPTKIDYRKKRVPTCSNLSTGGPRPYLLACFVRFGGPNNPVFLLVFPASRLSRFVRSGGSFKRNTLTCGKPLGVPLRWLPGPEQPNVEFKDAQSPFASPKNLDFGSQNCGISPHVVLPCWLLFKPHLSTRYPSAQSKAQTHVSQSTFGELEGKDSHECGNPCFLCFFLEAWFWDYDHLMRSFVMTHLRGDGDFESKV